MYLHGYGVQKDIQQAINFFKSAADKGNPDAQLNLGTLYFSKFFFPK